MFSDFKIVLPREIDQKIMYMVHKADKEISGLGDAEIDLENKLIIIKSAFLLKQECGPTEPEIDEQAVGAAMFQAHEDFVASQGAVNRSIKFWWHSHVNMGVFWSGTDKESIAKLSKNSWFSHIVFNKKGERLAAIGYPVTMESCGLTKTIVQYNDKIDIIHEPKAPSNNEAWDLEFKENYKEKSHVTTQGNWRSITDVDESKLDPKDILHKDEWHIIYLDNKELVWGRGAKGVRSYHRMRSDVCVLYPFLLKEMSNEGLRRLWVGINEFGGSAPSDKKNLDLIGAEVAARTLRALRSGEESPFPDDDLEGETYDLEDKDFYTQQELDDFYKEGGYGRG